MPAWKDLRKWERMDKKEKMQVGGQAVIEGVMMRSPKFFSVAVRRPDGKIVLKKEAYESWTRRKRFLGWPLIRGGVILIESLVLGMQALNFSGEVAMQEEDGKKKSAAVSGRSSRIWMGLTVVFALALGIGIFFFLPLVLTELTRVRSGVLFNLIDGAIRLALFLVYLVLISLWKEIRRVFEYHGAEHKSIFAFEEGKPLNLSSPLRNQLPPCRHDRVSASFHAAGEAAEHGGPAPAFSLHSGHRRRFL
jgi:uncharacterized protein YqhQ